MQPMASACKVTTHLTNAVMTCIEGLLGYVCLIPCFMGKEELLAEHVAQPFFDSVVCVFGLPDEVLHGRDPRFTADFWRHLWDSLGSRAVFSSACHPQTDGKAECANRTIE